MQDFSVERESASFMGHGGGKGLNLKLEREGDSQVHSRLITKKGDIRGRKLKSMGYFISTKGRWDQVKQKYGRFT